MYASAQTALHEKRIIRLRGCGHLGIGRGDASATLSCVGRITEAFTQVFCTRANQFRFSDGMRGSPTRRYPQLGVCADAFEFSQPMPQLR
jgi:hypothetical protein